MRPQIKIIQQPQLQMFQAVKTFFRKPYKPITPENVDKGINRLKNNKASGPDNI